MPLIVLSFFMVFCSGMLSLYAYQQDDSKLSFIASGVTVFSILIAIAGFFAMKG